MRVPVSLLLTLALTLACAFAPIDAHAKKTKASPTPKPSPTASPAAAPSASPSPAPEATPSASPSPTPNLSPEAKRIAEQGLKAFQKQDYKAARTAFQKLLELMPSHPMPLVNLATAEFRLGHKKEAQELLERAVLADPAAAGPWMTLGIVRLELDNLQGALAALSQSTYLDPKNSRAHGYLAVVAGRLGWNDAAEAEFRRAIELDDTYTDAHFNLALTYLERNPPALELARRHYYRARDLGARPDPIVEKKLEAIPPLP